MPILELEIVGIAEDFPANLAQLVADGAGVALSSRPQGTWVIISFIDTSRYAENGGAVDQPPIIARVLQAELPDTRTLKLQIAQLTRAISAAAKHPESSVHIIVEPAAKGRIAFGGTLVE